MSSIPDDNAPSWDMEITGDMADRTEEVLREFAGESELDLAVVVDSSGGMIAGVAARQDVDVATVGALVAGAFGAMRALAGELGEGKLVESMHHGGSDTLYLREIGNQCILLAVGEVSQPAGLIRELAARTASRLTELFAGTDIQGETAPVTPIAAPESPFETEESGGPVESASADEGVFEIDGEESVPMPSLDATVHEPEESEIEHHSEEAEPAPEKGPRYVFEIG